MPSLFCIGPSFVWSLRVVFYDCVEGYAVSSCSSSSSASFACCSAASAARNRVMYPAIWFLTFGVPPWTRVLTRCLLFSKSWLNLSGNFLMSSFAVRLICSVRTLPKLFAPDLGFVLFLCASCWFMC